MKLYCVMLRNEKMRCAKIYADGTIIPGILQKINFHFLLLVKLGERNIFHEEKFAVAIIRENLQN